MNYALIVDGIVMNIIWLHPMNVSDFPNAFPMNDLPVAIGDTYADGKFYRDGVEVTNTQPTPVTEDPDNTYGVPDETYHAIIDDYTMELLGGEL